MSVDLRGRSFLKLLEYAALLHEVGMHVSYQGHHRHSYYLIKNGDLRGFTPEEIEVIALIARYHRRAVPARKWAGPKRGRRRRLHQRLLGARSRGAVWTCCGPI